jgi:hypothetical protein
MRVSDLVDADHDATAAELTELERAGMVVREPAGSDAVWRAATRAGAGEARSVVARPA